MYRWRQLHRGCRRRAVSDQAGWSRIKKKYCCLIRNAISSWSTWGRVNRWRPVFQLFDAFRADASEFMDRLRMRQLNLVFGAPGASAAQFTRGPWVGHGGLRSPPKKNSPCAPTKARARVNSIRGLPHCVAVSRDKSFFAWREIWRPKGRGGVRRL